MKQSKPNICFLFLLLSCSRVRNTIQHILSLNNHVLVAAVYLRCMIQHESPKPVSAEYTTQYLTCGGHNEDTLIITVI